MPFQLGCVYCAGVILPAGQLDLNQCFSAKSTSITPNKYHVVSHQGVSDAFLMVQVNLVPVVESQSPRQRISNLNRKFFFANPESFAGWLPGCPEYLEIICIIRKTSRWSWE